MRAVVPSGASVPPAPLLASLARSLRSLGLVLAAASLIGCAARSQNSTGAVQPGTITAENAEDARKEAESTLSVGTMRHGSATG